jgi:hypothetical protein
MPATNAIKVVLRACDSSLNRYRSWSIEADQDLFGNWTARVLAIAGCVSACNFAPLMRGSASKSDPPASSGLGILLVRMERAGGGGCWLLRRSAGFDVST